MASICSTSEAFDIAFRFLSTSAFLAGILMLIRSAASEVFLEKLRSYFLSFFDYLSIRLSTNLTLVINEFDGPSRNEVYDAADLYLATKIGPKTKRFKLSKTKKQRNFAISIEKDEEIVDIFEEIQLKWRYKRGESSTDEKFFELSFHNKFKDKVVEVYLRHVLASAKEIEEESKMVKIYSCDFSKTRWRSRILQHPATFDTVGMDPTSKKMIIDDLESFLASSAIYRKVGKRQRGYLLYGPPGSGKSSLIAAMANHLMFDIYDLELASISSNSSLKKLLSSITNQSIVVIEDIDCSIKVPDRTNKLEHSSSEERLTLSGILNFIDGLWSSCGDEIIIVFPANHKDRLDPALLRPGRIAIHINLSYCTPCVFRLLAENYIGIKDHELFGEIEEAIRTMEVTSAEVVEQLMRNNNDPDALLNDLIQFLKVKKRENEEAKAKKNRPQQESTPSEGGQTEEEEIEQK